VSQSCAGKPVASHAEPPDRRGRPVCIRRPPAPIRHFFATYGLSAAERPRRLRDLSLDRRALLQRRRLKRLLPIGRPPSAAQKARARRRARPGCDAGATFAAGQGLFATCGADRGADPSSLSRGATGQRKSAAESLSLQPATPRWPGSWEATVCRDDAGFSDADNGDSRRCLANMSGSA
jgi:hypothetical protein